MGADQNKSLAMEFLLTGYLLYKGFYHSAVSVDGKGNLFCEERKPTTHIYKLCEEILTRGRENPRESPVRYSEVRANAVELLASPQ